MIENLKRMACGNCGGDNFRLFTADEALRIVVECQKCREVSYIQPAAARPEIGFGERSVGRLTVM